MHKLLSSLCAEYHTILFVLNISKYLFLMFVVFCLYRNIQNVVTCRFSRTYSWLFERVFKKRWLFWFTTLYISQIVFHSQTGPVYAQAWHRISFSLKLVYSKSFLETMVKTWNAMDLKTVKLVLPKTYCEHNAFRYVIKNIMFCVKMSEKIPSSTH